MTTKITKIDLGWFRASLYPDDMTRIKKIFKDKEFAEKFQALYDLVEDRTKLQHKGDISDFYFVFEQSVSDEN